MLRVTFILLSLCIGGLSAWETASAQPLVRIKDITAIEGVRNNQLTGLGIVSGLNGTGGRSPVTRQFAFNILQKLGVRADPFTRAGIRENTQENTDNLSVVSVTAELPSFARPGSRIDVLVSAFDDADSLQGGTLIATSLFGLDNKVYAVASGPVSIGGFSFSGNAASVQKNHPTSGRIPSGAIGEERVCADPIGADGTFRLMLGQWDYETCRRIVDSVNKQWPKTARVLDASTMEVRIPSAYASNVPRFIGLVNSLQVRPDSVARVVINERTGTVVVGANVKLSRVAITHANLSVITGESPIVSQPGPFSDGETTVVPRTQIDVLEEDSKVNVIGATATVGDLAKALNALGVSPRDLSSIFQQLDEAGALHAKSEMK